MSRYSRFVPYGLGHQGLKSREFERRSKRSFRRWLRRKGKHDAQMVIVIPDATACRDGEG